MSILRIMRKLLLLYLLLLPNWIYAYVGAGSADFPVMRLAFDARPISMGGAFTSMAEGVYGLSWNPAGLAFVRTPELLIGYRSLPEGVHAGIPAYARKYKNYGVGVAVQYLNYGEFEERDDNNNILQDKITPFSFVGITGIGKKINKKLSAGIAIKGIYEKLFTYVSHKGVVADIGLKYLPDYRRLGLGAVIQNVGYADTSYNEDVKLSFSMPITVKVGITNIFRMFPRTRFALDVVKPIEDVFEYRAGFEYRQSAKLFVRAGYCATQPELEEIVNNLTNDKKNNDIVPQKLQSWSVGAGYKTPKMTINYSVQSWSLFDLTHALSLMFYL